jgi:putative sterol carrier protein
VAGGVLAAKFRRRSDPDEETMIRAKRFRFYLATAIVAGCLPFGAQNANAASSTPQQVFDVMRQGFRADKAKGVHARYQWQLSGPNGGEYWIEVNDGKCKMGHGRISNPNVTFIATDQTWVALSNGTLSGTWAYVTGRLKIRGNKDFARKLGEMFP